MQKPYNLRKTVYIALFAVANTPYRQGPQITVAPGKVTAKVGLISFVLSKKILTKRVKNFTVVTGFGKVNDLQILYRDEPVDIEQLKETAGYNLAIKELQKYVNF